MDYRIRDYSGTWYLTPGTVDGETVLVLGVAYTWSSTSVEPHDGADVLAPSSAAGRWVKAGRSGGELFAPDRVSVRDLASVVASRIGQVIDTYDTNDSRIGWKYRWNGSEWKQTADRSFLHLDAYATQVGTNTSGARAANLAAWNAAIEDATNYGTEIHLGPYTYYVSDILTIDRYASTSRQGLRISGENAAGRSAGVTKIISSADAITQPVLYVVGNANVIRGIQFSLTGSGKALTAVECGPSASGSGVTANRFIDCCAIGSASNEMKNGFSIGAYYSPGSGSSLDDHVFEHCWADGISEAGFNIAGGQPYNTRLENCSAWNFTKAYPSGIGVRVAMSTAQATVVGGNWTNLERAFYMPYSGRLTLENIQSESCKRLIDSTGATTSTHNNISVVGGRCVTTNSAVATDNITAADERYIVHQGGGSLTMHGLTIAGETNAQDRNIRIDNEGPISAFGCFFPNDHVFDDPQLVGGLTSARTKPLTIVDCHTFHPDDSTTMRYPMQPSGARNSGGVVTIRGTASSITVPINDEADARYQVIATVVSTSGTPAAGSSRVSAGSRTTTSFVLTLEAAPGAGNSVTIYWEIRRVHIEPPAVVASTAYGFYGSSSSDYYESIEASDPGTEGAGLFFYGVLFQFPSAPTSRNRKLLSNYDTNGFLLDASGSAPVISGLAIADSGGFIATPTKTLSAGDYAKLHLAIVVHDGTHLRLYFDNAEIGSGTSITGYKKSAGAIRIGAYTTTNQVAYDAYLYGAFCGSGAPSLANVQSYFASVKAAYDIVAEMPGGTMTHAWSIAQERRGNAPKFLRDLAGHTFQKRRGNALAVTSSAPTWGW